MEDYNQINDINPYTPDRTIMPGTWSGNFPYARHVDVSSSSDDEDEPERSPLCGYANTMGDGTIHACNPTPPNCPLGRPLIPGRNIEDGLWSLPCSRESQGHADRAFPMFMIVMILAILLTVTLRT